MKKALCVVGGILAVGAVAYCAMILYVSVALADAMYNFRIEEDPEE